MADSLAPTDILRLQADNADTSAADARKRLALAQAAIADIQAEIDRYCAQSATLRTAISQLEGMANG